MHVPKVDRWVARLGGWLVPPQCLLCHGRGQSPAFDLCAVCEADLPQLETPCPRCGLPMDADAATAAACRQCGGVPLVFDRVFAPYLSAAPMDGIIHALKYDGALANARVLGVLLGRAVTLRGLHHRVNAIVPMPLHPDRLVDRGFNQSYELARFTARCIGRPCEPRALARTRATSAQVELSRAERERNVENAFGPSIRAGRVRGLRVALIDDVITTGSTAKAASRALLDIGARSVDVWSIARAV